MIAEIEKYIEIQNNIDEILKNSPFKMSYIIEKSGIKKPTFFKKLKEKRFTPEELLIISKTIEPQWKNETKEEILESLKRAEEEIKNGETTDFYDFVAERREKLKTLGNAKN
ncbi:hypothetical protein NAL32_16140 [Chryseobacterium sp. Ch-15]|uniref:Uncharacterized protein n=1 Tax=Chryseobacterium muglaense TaxID=2893752 RepID=A0A9Q3UVJ0_9FLAO|nr:hypothetical protein [Chryseobacterium muglaense]MBD3906181.1 hypothetical protein [Chryseobacterium muglaense]MCC9033800.1 hypothetical protein [Chryseobacterium muglaense]MCM2555916.1 hypothetical protein [Chryseobacterium muglaense]